MEHSGIVAGVADDDLAADNVAVQAVDIAAVVAENKEVK